MEKQRRKEDDAIGFEIVKKGKPYTDKKEKKMEKPMEKPKPKK